MFYRHGVIVTTSAAFNAEWIGINEAHEYEPMWFRTAAQAQEIADKCNATDFETARIVTR